MKRRLKPTEIEDMVKRKKRGYIRTDTANKINADGSTCDKQSRIEDSPDNGIQRSRRVISRVDSDHPSRPS